MYRQSNLPIGIKHLYWVYLLHPKI